MKKIIIALMIVSISVANWIFAGAPVETSSCIKCLSNQWDDKPDKHCHKTMNLCSNSGAGCCGAMSVADANEARGEARGGVMNEISVEDDNSCGFGF